MPEDINSRKRNILLWKFGRLHSDLQNYLADDVVVKVWIDKAKYPTTTHDMNLFYRNLPLKKKDAATLPINYQYRKDFLKIYRELLLSANTFMYMYNRHPGLNRENNFLDTMDAFYIYLHYFTDMLKTNDIDCVFFSLIPHHADYILYQVAKALKIKTVMFFPATELGKSFMVTDIDQLGAISGDKNIQPIPIKRKERKSYFYMDNIPKPRLYKKLISALLFRRDMDLFFHRLMNLRREMRFKRDYKKMVSDNLPDGKFVYFPLHLQPELTTQSLGGIFVDQILAIECLRALLPDEWKIVVKENPKQTAYSRGRLFFHRLSKIPGVVYVGKTLNTFDLLEKSEFCATITGTAGFEALTFGKKVLVFGQAFYKNFPGAIQYTDTLSFDDVVATSFTHAALELAYAKLVHGMLDVVTDKDFSDYILLTDQFSEAKNTQKLAEIINQMVGT